MAENWFKYWAVTVRRAGSGKLETLLITAKTEEEAKGKVGWGRIIKVRLVKTEELKKAGLIR